MKTVVSNVDSIPIFHQMAISCYFLLACLTNLIEQFCIIPDNTCQPVQPTTVEPTTVAPTSVEPTEGATGEPTMQPVNPNCTSNQDTNVNIGDSMMCTGVFRCINGRKDCSGSLNPYGVSFYVQEFFSIMFEYYYVVLA